MSTRISETFAKIKNRAALITYIMAGDPDAKLALEIMKSLPAAGADIIELGMPFSDPMADGKTIQEAAIRSLKSGTNLAKVLQQVYNFRQFNQETPIILMGYYNPIFHYGISEFCEDAKLAGADGFIIVDLPPEEDAEFFAEATKHDLATIRLIAPTTDDTRLKKILKSASGFVYYISMAGVTGAKSANTKSVVPAIKNVQARTKLPVCVGFGIKTPEQAAEIGKFANGVVVGSALVEIIAKNTNLDAHVLQDAVFSFVQKIAKSLKK